MGRLTASATFMETLFQADSVNRLRVAPMMMASAPALAAVCTMACATSSASTNAVTGRIPRLPRAASIGSTRRFPNSSM